MPEIYSKNFRILVTTNFKRDAKRLAKKYKSFKTDLALLVDELEKNPTLGKQVGKDCYKIRMAISSKRKRKRSGARVITLVKIVTESVYLLAVYDKSDKEGLSDKELDYLIKISEV